MSLTSTLFTGLSGLGVNQTRLNVVGNNIANVNTVAFKASRALFTPQFYVTDADGSPPGANFGGTNPSQRGLGASVAAIEKDWTSGTIEPTGRGTDMAIDGNGFFVVDGPSGRKYTRDGSFNLSSANDLVSKNGDFVQGFGVDAKYQVIPGQLGRINIPMGAQTVAEATTKALMVGNLDASGDLANGAKILLSSAMTSAGGTTAPDATTLLTDLEQNDAGNTAMFAVNDVVTVNGTKGGREVGAQKFTVTATSTLGDLADFMQGALGIDMGLSVTGAPTAGVTIEADTATTVRLGVTSNVGVENALDITSAGFQKQDGTGPLTFMEGSAGGFDSNPTGESVATSFVAYDSLGTPITIGFTATLTDKTNEGTTWSFTAISTDDKNLNNPVGAGAVVGSGTLTFDNFGKLKSTTGTELSVDRDLTGSGTPLNLNLDFSGMTSLTSRTSQAVMTQQNGSPIGTLDSFSIGEDGTITGLFTNGRTRTLGQVALATFNNPQGLMDRGNNYFVEGSNSGVATISSPLALSAGAVRAGALELSNVDLSEQFINMIISTTGFSAASRVISSADRLMQELLNTSR